MSSYRQRLVLPWPRQQMKKEEQSLPLLQPLPVSPFQEQRKALLFVPWQLTCAMNTPKKYSI